MKHTVASALPCSLFIAAALLIGCGDKDADNDGTATLDSNATTTTDGATTSSEATADASADASWTAAYPATEDGAKALLEEFLKPGADHLALTKPLQPTTADYQAIFSDAEFAAKADAAYGGLWAGQPMSIAPKDGQTELKLWSATTEELKAGTGNSDEFPGGYKEVADKFADGLTLYRFKFVVPGEDLGMAYDGLVHVNGNWRIVPKPWAVAEAG